METQANPIVIKQGNGIGAVGAIVLIFGAGAGIFFGNRYLKQRRLNEAEGETNTEEGQIALEFKNLFDSFVVSDADFRRINVKVNAANKAKVYEIYYKLTSRNLSNDIAEKISSKTVTNSQKIERYNSKPSGLFRVDENEKIVFTVGTNDYAAFDQTSGKSVSFYNLPFGIILNELNSPALVENLKKNPKTAPATVKINVTPSNKIFKVLETKIIPIESVRKADGWQGYLRYVNTKKTFAAVKLLLSKKNGKPVTAWVDARDMVKYTKKLNGVMGLAY